MMSNFYARYVPPGKSLNGVESHVSKPEKRKHVDEIIQPEQTQKKQKKSQQSSKVNSSKAVGRKKDSVEPQVERTEVATENRTNVLDKYKVTAVARTNDILDVRLRKSQLPPAEDVEAKEGTSKGKKVKTEVKAHVNHAEDPAIKEDEVQSDGEYEQRHSAVLSKFNKAMRVRETINGDSESQASQSEVDGLTEIHGLQPIPQPMDKEVIPGQQTYSTLSTWQSHAVRVVHGSRPTFDSFSISNALRENLKKNGLEYAFPIQSTVLPLLLDGSQRHKGDLCVSAATGSGKTLAYVIPMIEALKEMVSTKLRGLIIVPTRELVQQVRQLCEICSAGTNLSIATAVGNKSLTEEQAMLLEEEEVYDPEEWEKQQANPVDWSNFSLPDLFQDVQSSKPLMSMHFVKKYKSKVDILISTPGRLVDHLQSTRGFTLDHVKWLVVDEADRLLSESYQEWVEVVVPALRSQAATANRDEILLHMRIQPPTRSVTKVLLSATMTKDITKLNSLGLQNPKLVILGNSTFEDNTQTPPDDTVIEDVVAQTNGDGHFHLPDTLSEYMLPVKDGADKPLYLLKLLQKHIAQDQQMQYQNTKPMAKSPSDTSTSDSDSSSSTGSSSDSSSSSESDSESESESDTSSSSEKAPPKSNLFLQPHRPSRQAKPSARPGALIFTRSTASAMRLSRLLMLLSPSLAPQITTLTRSTASSASSRRAFSSFRNGKTSLLIATDRASRGLDLPDLEHVISYDVPTSALTYIHRVGRTARAGKTGQAWTLVEHREGAWFWREIGGKKAEVKSKVKRKDEEEIRNKEPDVEIQRHEKIRRMNLEIDDDDLKARYEEALKKLGEEVQGQ